LTEVDFDSLGDELQGVAGIRQAFERMVSYFVMEICGAPPQVQKPAAADAEGGTRCLEQHRRSKT
jgi:hypothetical protein